MSKICLVYPDKANLPKSFEVATTIYNKYSKTLPPLGLLSIISNSYFPIDFIDNSVHRYSFEELAKILNQYELIGFGGTIFSIKEARKLSHYLLKKGKTTFYGGPNATVNWSLYLGDFSIIFRGEAEENFDEFIANINDLKSLGFQKIKGTYVNTQLFRVKNIDNLRYPAREKININDYQREGAHSLKNIFPVDSIVSSRGCPFDCYYCSSRNLWSNDFTFRSADNVIEEILFMKDKYHTKGICFRDDNFTANKKRLKEFCEKVKNIDIVWMCASRVDTLDKESIRLMADGGCKWIWFGIESTSKEVQKIICKNLNLKRAVETIKYCTECGIQTGTLFMIGFPFDDKNSIIRNYKDSLKFPSTVRSYNRVFAIPQSKMYQEIMDNHLDEFVFENIILPRTYHLSAKEVDKLYFRLVSGKEVLQNRILNFIGKRNIELIKKYLLVFAFFLRFYFLFTMYFNKYPVEHLLQSLFRKCSDRARRIF